MHTRLLALVAVVASLVAPPAAGAQDPPPAGSSSAGGGAATTGTTGTSGTAGTTTGTAGATAPRVPSTAANTPVSRPVAADYRITTGDKLRVEVYKDAQLSQSLQVRPDGKITLPLIGDIEAVGSTPLELRERIATSLKEYVTNPVVTVIVVETVSPTVFVMGEVTNPGALAMNGPMTVLQALAMAGGFKDFANVKDIRVLRRDKQGVQTIKFNYKAAMKGEGDAVTLQPGDTVIVP